MQRALAVITVVLALVQCSREPKAAAAKPSFDQRQFFTFVLLTTRADAELAATAAKRGREPETRAFGTALKQQQQQMYDALMPLAQSRRLTIPEGIEERKAALRDNLAILPGQVFDRGYNLAMLQDLRRLRAALQGATASQDAQLTAYANRFLPAVKQMEDTAGKALQASGGSPFQFE